MLAPGSHLGEERIVFMKSARYSLESLASIVDGEVTGDGSVEISALNGLEQAGPGEITFILSARQLDALAASGASACIVPRDVGTVPLPAIRVSDPNLAAAVIHNHLLSRPFVATGIHATAVVGEGSEIATEVSVGPRVCIGTGCRIGRRVCLHAGVVIGDDVRIGDDTILHANVVVASGCRIGRRVILHHGAVIGSDGFGFATDRRSGKHVKKPQVGIVRIEDDVEIGANSCVDRAAFGETLIRKGVRIDNLVQVAHNVEIGENSILVAQTGVAGSTRLGRNVVLGAKVGVADHLHLEDGVMAAAMSGIHNNQPGGAVVGGIPAIDVRQWGRATAVFARLPEMRRELRRMRREIDRLSRQLAAGEKEEEHDERTEI